MTPIETQTTIQSDSNIADIPLMLCRSLVLAYKLTTRVVKFRRGGGGTKKKRKPKRGRQDAQKVVGSVSFKVGDCWRKYGLYLL